MTPSEICAVFLGNDHLDAVVGKLSSPQVKAVLKEGRLSRKLPAGIVTQAKRRSVWSTRIRTAVLENQDDDAASELLQQWLLNHEREMLISFLDALSVKHRAGETDQSFLFHCPEDETLKQALVLLQQHDSRAVACYLTYVAHQQKSPLFLDWEPLKPLRVDVEEHQESS